MNPRYLVASLALLLAGAPAGAEAYRLGPQDHLRIAVYEYPNLNGEYTVGATGAVAVPLLGELAAEGRTPRELADTIATALAEAMRSPAAISAIVEVTEYRPIFVLGDVERPGPYAYQPGLRMLQALALAGGVYRLADVGLLRISQDAIEAEGEIRVLKGRERDLGLERERLEAELNGAEAPAFTAAAGERDEWAMERQQMMFTTRRAALARQSGTLGELIGSLREELDALDRQGLLKQKQVGTVEEELVSTLELVGKGLTPRARGLELERLQADLESDRQEVVTDKLRVRQAIARTEQSLFSLSDDRRADVAAALEQVHRQIAETAAALETQRSLLADAVSAAPELRRLVGNDALPLLYSVARFAGDETIHREVGEGATVMPGDVITIRVGDPITGAANPRRAAEVKP